MPGTAGFRQDYEKDNKYWGKMPDGTWQEFDTQNEYWEAYETWSGVTVIKRRRPSLNGWQTYLWLHHRGLV